MSELKKEFRGILVGALPALEFMSGSVDAIVEGIGNAYVLIRKENLPEVTESGSGYLTASGRTLAHTSHTVEEMLAFVKAAAATLVYMQQQKSTDDAKRKARRSEILKELGYLHFHVQPDGPISRAVDRIIELETNQPTTTGNP